jgi:hypothetical protein
MSTATTSVTLTPAMMAEAFWSMGDTEQVEFFAELAKVIKKDHETNTQAYGLGELQWCYLTEVLEKKENKEAKDMLMTMASFLYWHTLNYKGAV